MLKTSDVKVACIGLQGNYPPMPPPMPPSAENLQGGDLLRYRCHFGSKLMSSEEIENILRIQYKFLNSGAAYNEDYYYLVRPLIPCLASLGLGIPPAKLPAHQTTLTRVVETIFTLFLMRKTDQWQTADQLPSDHFSVSMQSNHCLKVCEMPVGRLFLVREGQRLIK